MPQEGQDLIRVTNRDIRKNTLVCVDPTHNIWIRMGFPRNQDTGIVDQEIMRNLSGPPYVFTVDELTLIDSKHPSAITVKDVTVIFMHGGRKTAGKWMFARPEDGYPVVETVEKVNQYLRGKGKKPIQVIMACNNYPLTNNVKIGDFLSGVQIVYAVGETVGLEHAEMTEDGRITATIIASDFWNLDKLIAEQRTRIISQKD